jgi:hypothetical protein
MKVFFAFVFLVTGSIFTFTALGQSNCELTNVKDGISISRCKVEGSAYDGVYVEFESEGELEHYLRLATDAPNFVNWHYKIDKVEMIPDADIEGIVYRSEIDTPWPLTTREMIVQVEVEKADTAATVVTKSIPGYIPLRKAYLRIPYSYSKMEVQKLEGDSLKFSYYVEVDPGGNVPAWIVNMFSSQGPYHTFSRLKSILTKEAF